MKTRALAGEHLTGCPPYGYVTSEKDRKQWVIDEEAAEHIRTIYNLYIGGMTFKQIAEEMTRRGIPSPSKHIEKYGVYKPGRRIKLEGVPDFWHPGSVIAIIDRYEYAGHTVSYRFQSESCKTSKTVKVPESEWIITRNTQPAIIDEETWQTVKRVRDSGRRRKVNIHDKGPLNGLIYCDSCGSKLYFKPTPRLKDHGGCYMCGYYLHYTKMNLCTTHYIRRSDLEEVVLARLRMVTDFAKENESEFVKMVERKSHKKGEATLRKNEKELTATQKRLAEIDRIINRLYEDKVTGELTSERFATMLAGFEDEQGQLRKRSEELRIAIAHEKESTDGAERFIKQVRQITNMEELTTEIAVTLIEKVIVSQAEKVNGQNQQKIKIIYNFIGDIDEEVTE